MLCSQKQIKRINSGLRPVLTSMSVSMTAFTLSSPREEGENSKSKSFDNGDSKQGKESLPEISVC